jgi:hypothetical protein
MEPEQLAENRRQLARLARQKKRRRIPRELPCSWLPGTVLDPGSNQPFTDAGAWELIAQLLDDFEGQAVRVQTLDHPAGVVAYVMEYPLPLRNLYIKVHYGNGPSILGRSFHYSDYPS